VNLAVPEVLDEYTCYKEYDMNHKNNADVLLASGIVRARGDIPVGSCLQGRSSHVSSDSCVEHVVRRQLTVYTNTRANWNIQRQFAKPNTGDALCNLADKPAKHS
jgi:hypothetical protein